jgi:RNA polymerase sigma-70 factor (ECF subfamily)
MKLNSAAALPQLAWEGELLEDASHRRLVLELYDREHLALKRYFIFLGLDNDSAEEILQESFLRLHQHLGGGGDRGNLRAWLYRVGHNLARNEQKAFRTSRTDSLPDAKEGRELSGTVATPEEKLLADEQMNRLAMAMEQLSAAQRQCLLLRAQGFKYREIADVLGLSVSTVGENVQRGLENLKELL